jgi:hypothetical protein
VQAVQGERGERAAGLGQHHAFGGEHQPDRRRGVVGEHRAQPGELLGQHIEGIDRAVPGGLRITSRAGEAGEQAPHRAPVGGEQPFQVARQRLRQRQQPQRLGRGAAVDDHDVPRSVLGGAAHLAESEQLLDAGQHRELVGHQLVDAGAGQQGAEVAAQGTPRVVEECPRVDVRGREAGLQLGGLATELALQRIAQGVGRIGGHHQHLAP